jgi:ABC-type bacteriocin/lantibiotic exporter with double-glycine peptidase domain
MQIVIIAVGAITADYFNIMINHAIASKSIKNGLIIMLIFGLFFLLEALMHYTLTLYSAKHFKINFHFLSRQLINALNNKNCTFFHKVDSNYLYLIDTAMQSITIFIVMEVSALCSNCILVITITCIIAVINPWFLCITFIAIILAIGFNTVQYYYRKHMTKIGLENQRINNGISHRFIDYFRTQHNYLLKNELSHQLEQNYTDFQRIYLMQAKFNGAFNFFEGMVHNIIYLVLIMVGCYLIVEYQNINIGQLTFLISLVSMMSGAFNGICEFVTKRIEYVQMSAIYKNFIMLGNYESKGNNALDKIKEITFDGKALLSGHVYQQDQQLTNALFLEKTNGKLLINGVPIDSFDYKSYLRQLFVINHDTKIDRS